ncbi:bifunctional 4-hydroxy-2-oxoglutarate aldolase/2-dehydro-3-deoxy-phosphogluconate aldolase [Alicyclobacillus sp. SO9]|nr:bifunctional 4-hydroxy-2-oxoglutarate aldolase/2-dehydro-3-deoxy-phosphogluconate aldolase [Alicyclobacillus sp. SO9]
MRRSRIIAILRRIPLESAVQITDAAIEGGIRVVEVTLEGKDGLKVLYTLRDKYEDQLLLGAGTVMSCEQIKEASKAGAQVLFSPYLDVKLLDCAQENDILLVPGVTTPTEIVRANQAGAKVLKLFPANSLGVEYLKSLLGPFPEISVIPTGGITRANARSYLETGALAVGMGSELFPRTDVEQGNWSEIIRLISNTLESLS